MGLMLTANQKLKFYNFADCATSLLGKGKHGLSGQATVVG
jgi:hypothetical protein